LRAARADVGEDILLERETTQHERLEQVEVALLLGVVGGHAAQVGEGRSDGRRAAVVGLEEDLVAREQEAALPGLGVDHRRQQAVELLDDAVRMLHPALRAEEARQLARRQRDDGAEDEQRRREDERGCAAALHRAAPAGAGNGSVIQKRLPPPVASSTPMRPPCASTSRRRWR
jgi:hypothetical protein